MVNAVVTRGVLEFNYDGIVQAHDELLGVMQTRHEQLATVIGQAGAARDSADGMDDGRQSLAASAKELIDAMADAGFDSSSVEGCAAVADTFTADDAGLIEETCEALVDRATSMKGLTEAAQEAAGASRTHIVDTYGELAAGVQATGVRGASLESTGS